MGWGRLPSSPGAPVTKEGFAESCTSVLHFHMVLLEGGLWDLMTWPFFTVPVRNLTGEHSRFNPERWT